MARWLAYSGNLSVPEGKWVNTRASRGMEVQCLVVVSTVSDPRAKARNKALTLGKYQNFEMSDIASKMRTEAVRDSSSFMGG
jgi:hypothetical protein